MGRQKSVMYVVNVVDNLGAYLVEESPELADRPVDLSSNHGVVPVPMASWH